MAGFNYKGDNVTINTSQTAGQRDLSIKIEHSSCGSPYDHKATFTLTSSGFDKHNAVDEMNKAIDYIEADMKVAREEIRSL